MVGKNGTGERAERSAHSHGRAASSERAESLHIMGSAWAKARALAGQPMPVDARWSSVRVNVCWEACGSGRDCLGAAASVLARLGQLLRE